MTTTPRRRTRMMLSLALFSAVGTLSGCASLSGGDRRQFAAHVAEGSAPILKGYRNYVNGDASLSEDDKRMRLRLADEFDQYVKGGSK